MLTFGTTADFHGCGKTDSKQIGEIKKKKESIIKIKTVADAIPSKEILQLPAKIIPIGRLINIRESFYGKTIAAPSPPSVTRLFVSVRLSATLLLSRKIKELKQCSNSLADNDEINIKWESDGMMEERKR